MTMGLLLYLDPTTGGVLLQVILGGVGGGLVLVKLFWHRLGSLFARSKRRTSRGSEAGTSELDQ